MTTGLTDYDLDRLEALRRARWRATALLAAVAVVFVVTFFLPPASWVGFLRTTAEASLIGGLADWFAVTALFRHPLGLPIPHTAIIPRSKTGLARSLGEFVERNFFSPDQLIERLEAAGLPARLAKWLSDEHNADLFAGHLATAAGALTESGESEGLFDELLETMPVARWLGVAAEGAIERGHHRFLVDAAVRGITTVLEDNRSFLRERVGQESPWWVPAPLDDAVFNRAYAALRRFLDDVTADPAHEVRRTIDRRLLETARRLQTDPEWARTVNERLADVVGVGLAELRSSLAGQLAAAGRSPDSAVRQRLARSLRRLGERMDTDQLLQERIEGWLQALAGPVSRLGQRELGDLIAVTVERWDPVDTSRRLELWMGRDLQFVRINGTVVGGLAGLGIHTVVFLLTA